MEQNERTAIQMAKENKNVNAEIRKDIQQVINEAAIIARKIQILHFCFDGDDDGEDRRHKAIGKALQGVEVVIEALGELYGYMIIDRAMDIIDMGEELTDEQAISILTENAPEV